MCKLGFICKILNFAIIYQYGMFAYSGNNCTTENIILKSYVSPSSKLIYLYIHHAVSIKQMFVGLCQNLSITLYLSAKFV